MPLPGFYLNFKTIGHNIIAMRSFFARFVGAHRVRITIIPDRDYIFLTGYGDEAQGQFLQGKINLFISKDDSVDAVGIKMVGRMTVRDHVTRECAKTENVEVLSFFWGKSVIETTVKHLSTHGTTYEWPFALFLRGNQHESFRGCGCCKLAYNVEVSALSGASYSANHSIPIRIIRCPSVSSYEFMDPITTHGTWPSIECEVSANPRAIALEGQVYVTVKVKTLRPGVLITAARLYVRESHTIHNDVKIPIFNGIRTVVNWPLIPNSTAEQSHHWQQFIPLPKVVRSCSPSFQVSGVRTKHTLHVELTIADDTGSKTKYETSMPITLFISPDLPVNGWDIFVRDGTKTARSVVKTLSEGIKAPPQYSAYDTGNEIGVGFGDLPPEYGQPPAYDVERQSKQVES